MFIYITLQESLFPFIFFLPGRLERKRDGEAVFNDESVQKFHFCLVHNLITTTPSNIHTPPSITLSIKNCLRMVVVCSDRRLAIYLSRNLEMCHSLLFSRSGPNLLQMFFSLSLSSLSIPSYFSCLCIHAIPGGWFGKY